MKKSFRAIKENAWMYYITKDNKFTFYEGTVCIDNKLAEYDIANFIKRCNNEISTCSIDPMNVYQGKIWLPERDDSLAKSLLISYYQKENLILTLKTKENINMINILKEEDQNGCK